MPFLSPAKLLVILVVALVVLGPDKLPRVAKQIGGLWGDFRLFRQKLESEVRGNFPDLPSSQAITQAVRSPLSFLDNLAEASNTDEEATAVAVDNIEAMRSRNTATTSISDGENAAEAQVPPDHPIVTRHQVRSSGEVLTEGYGMN